MTTPLDSVLPGVPHARVLIDLRWGDQDAYGHINNVAIVRLLEEARVRLLGSPTADRDARDTSGRDSADDTGDPAWRVFDAAAADSRFLVAQHRVEYRRPVAYRPGPIEIDMVLSRLDAVSITLGYVLGDPGSDVACVLAETEIVFVRAADDRPRRLTPEERGRLEPLLAAPVPLRRR